MPKPPDSRYALRALLGRGGMGEVWLAHDLRIDRDIAVKLMRGEPTKNPDAVARFLREARVQGRLEHPAVVPVHDLGGDESAPFFAMKRLIGTTLADVINRPDHDKWPRRALLTRFVDVCLAVEFAHQRGVIHRDLKPANIMLGDFGETYVLDWGLAHIADTVDSGVIRASDLPGDSGVVSGQTEAGAMLGTPGYMPPEQMRGDAIDERADVFALGCVLFEILAGQPAIPRDRTLEVTLTTACHRPAQRVADVPPELDHLCSLATAADREQRIGTARDLAEGVQRYLDGDRDLARRRELAAAHVKRAQELIAGDTIAARAEAMREAGSAIALEPGNRDAQTVLARLLLEVPKEVPPAARRAIERERQQTMRMVVRRGLAVYLAFFVTLPISRLFGITGTWPYIALGSELAALIAILAISLVRNWQYTPRLLIAVATLHVAMLATFGVAVGALFVLPILIFGTLPIMLVAPGVRVPKTIFALHALALAIPIGLEALSIVPSSYTLSSNAIILHPWALTMGSQALLFILVATCVLQLVGNTVILDGQRGEQDRAQELLHLQKWQLEQLVPSAES